MSILNVNTIQPVGSGQTITVNAANFSIPTTSFTVSAGSASAPSISPSGDSNTGIFFPSADTVAIGEGGTEVLRIDSNGNVGIGFTNPTGKLQISGNIRVRNSTVSMDSQSIEFSESGTGNSYGVRMGHTANTSLAFERYDGGWSEIMRLAGNGNLGIGINNPTSKLHISGNTTSNIVADFNIARSGAVNTSVGQGAAIQFQNSTSSKFVLIQGSDDIFQVFNYGGSSWVERMRIDANGRVLKPYTPHIYGSPTNATTVSSSFATSFAIVTSTELTYSNDRVTVPVAGVYLITFCTLSNSDSSRKDAYVYINGTIRLAGLSEDTTTGYHYRGLSTTIKLAANDYIQFWNQNWFNNTNTSFDQWRTASVTFLG